MTTVNSPIPALPSRAIYGLRHICGATSVQTNAGNAWDSSSTFNMVLDEVTNLVATLNGINGLDTGSLGASTWYYLYLIGDSSGRNVVGTILSANSSTPVLPFGYDLYKLIGYCLTDGSSEFLSLFITGDGESRVHNWQSEISVLSAGTATTLTAIDLSTAVPLLDSSLVTVDVSFTPNTAGDSVMLVAGNSLSTAGARLSGVVATKAQIAQLQVVASDVSDVSTINYINSAATGATTVLVNAFSY